VSKLYWASIGGGKTEPVRVAEENGKRVFYSIGCTDPHDMEGVELIEEIDAMPLSKRSQAAQDAANVRWERQRAAERMASGRNASYRRWDDTQPAQVCLKSLSTLSRIKS
jgi:hypothetical protein